MFDCQKIVQASNENGGPTIAGANKLETDTVHIDNDGNVIEWNTNMGEITCLSDD